MNLDFSDEQKQLRDQIRGYLQRTCSSARVRAVFNGAEPFDRELYRGLAELGVVGAAIPEEFGGVGLSYLELCLAGEEMGRVLAPAPMLSSIYLGAEFLLQAGSPAQQAHWLPQLASGKAVATFAWVEGRGPMTVEKVRASVRRGRLNGTKTAVPDGAAADVCVVAAAGEGGVSLYLVDLNADGVSRHPITNLDPTKAQAQIEFTDAPAELLGGNGDAAHVISQVFDRAAVLLAFEQLGGADRTLEMARDYALDRMAFGRPIGSLQAIKHMLANMYVAATLARSNCYYGAWALANSAPELPTAAASARISATNAFQECARNNIQVHGGMGFTFELDCHLFYRRANALALALGPMSQWEGALVDRLAANLSAAG
jgi:alkylation response protein AidB-like acyl-CoA dehydrogenase